MISSNSFKTNVFVTLVVIILIVFIAGKPSEEGDYEIATGTELYNPRFDNLPDKYVALLEQKAIDTVTHRKRQKLYNALKFDAHFYENGKYLELILIKKADSSSVLIPNDIRFDIYPTSKVNDEKKYFTLESRGVIYKYGNDNYQVVKQVLPNIEIEKIVPYNRFWQSLIKEVNNQKYLVLNEQLSSSKLERSVFDFLLKKELEENDILFWKPDSNIDQRSSAPTNETLDGYAKQHNLSIIQISNDILFWDKLTNQRELTQFNTIGIDGFSESWLFSNYSGVNASLAKIIDIDKLTNYYSLLNLYTRDNDRELYLYLNPETSLLEPFFVHKILGKENSFVKDLKIKDDLFLRRYVEKLKFFAAHKRTSDLIVAYDTVIKNMLTAIHKSDPTQIFDEMTFHHNALVMEKALNASTKAKIELKNYDGNSIEVEIRNWATFPLEITELSFEGKKHISTPILEKDLIHYDDKSLVRFNLPKSFDNLFVHKKKKTTGFILEQDIFKLRVGYKVLGTEHIQHDPILPYSTKTNHDYDDLFRQEIEVEKYAFLEFNQEQGTIKLKDDEVVIQEPVLLPAGYVFELEKGQKIDIQNGGKIISRSSVRFLGSDEDRIEIYSSDKKGQGILVLNGEGISEMRYVDFIGLDNPQHGLWDVSGAVTFYQSPVNLNEVVIKDNSCEDALNIIRTNFTMENSKFINTQSDAFDGDFVTGVIRDSEFINLGNDAVDVSGSKLELIAIKVSKAGDKGISAGEDSYINANNIVIEESEIAVASKDLSTLIIDNLEMINSKLGFTAFQKKPEFGPSKIVATNVLNTGLQTLHLIEHRSILKLNDSVVPTIEQVKDRMYGIEFGIDSKDTQSR